MITYKFRIYPSKKQQSVLWQHANRLNRLYNHFLDMKINAYKENGENLSKYTLQAMLPEMKKNDEILKQIHSQVIQGVTKRLDLTYQAFFRRVKNKESGGFPRFRSCRKFFGIHYPQSGYSITNKFLKTRVYGNIPIIQHRKLRGNIKNITITTDNNNRWFVSILTDYEKEKTNDPGAIGVDVGITNLAALSDGTIIKNKGHARYFDKQISKLQSRRSRCRKGSRKYRRFSRTIRGLYDVKGRKINDFQHKVSKNLSTKYDTIIIEDLKLKEMSENNYRGLNRELRNSSLASFIDKLSYKCNQLIKVNPRNTSKACNNCGKLHSMPLSKRILICDCGYENDRDINAAKNIYCLGQAIISGLCTVKTCLQETLSFREE